MIAYILNLIDLCFTLHAIRNGATELNPLLQSVPVMVAVKVVGVWVLCWWVHRRPEKIARCGMKICAAVFAVVDAYHLINIL